MLNIVAGGAGFLGSHLVNTLVDDGETVIVIDNLATGHLRNLEHAISTGGATFIYADVAVPSPDLAELIYKATRQRAGRVFHFASPAKPDAQHSTSWETLEANALGTMSLIEVAIAHEATFLFASSAAVRDANAGNTFRFFTDFDSIDRRCSYEEGKRFGETTVAIAVKTRGLDARIVRLHDCYGPAMNAQSMPLVTALFRAAIAGEPFPIGGIETYACSLTYAADATSLVRIVADAPSTRLVPVDIASDTEVTVEHIARTIAHIAEVEFQVSETTGLENVPELLPPDLTVARSYGWNPSTSLADGLRAAFIWTRNKRVAFV